jgi:hypothetical protein
MDTADFFDQHRNDTFDFPSIPQYLTDIYQQASWIIFSSGIPYLPLAIDGPWKIMHQEALSLSDEFVAHRSDGAGWSSLCIHGISASHTMSASSYPEYINIPDDQVPYIWTEIQDRCPITVQYFRDVFPYDKYTRLRYMKLAAGGYIPPHTDGPGNRMTAVNISLNTPVGCEMVMESVGVVPFRDTGGAIAFNNTRTHSVRNLSAVDRYHIIVHGIWTDRYAKLVVDSYQRLLDVD